MTEELFPPPPSPAALGRPTRKAARAAIAAHRAVLDGAPMRVAISDALGEAPDLGGKERRFAALAARELSRHQRLLDHCARALGRPLASLALRGDQALLRYTLWRRLFTAAPWSALGAEVILPGPLRPRSIRDAELEAVASAPLPALELPGEPVERAAAVHSFPGWLARSIAAACGAQRLPGVLRALNAEPRIILRAAPGEREVALDALAAEGLAVERVAWSPWAIRVLDPGTRVFELRATRALRLQSQDVGSQLIAELCAGSEGIAGRTVGDLCAGAGGKTLALAALVGARGRVIATDRSRRRLAEARRRTAGLCNVAFESAPSIEALDVALIDAPCSGVGALAREPDQKWKLDAEQVAAFARTQRALVTDIARRLAPGACLVYATCSLLREENEAVVEAVLAGCPDLALEDAREVLGGARHALCDGPYLRVWPDVVEGGGFFAARLRRQG